LLINHFYLFFFDFLSIGKDITETDIRTEFNKYGKIKEINIWGAKNGSRPSAFVEYEHENEAAAAKLALHGTQTLCGQNTEKNENNENNDFTNPPLTIDFARPHRPRNEFSRGGFRGGRGGRFDDRNDRFDNRRDNRYNDRGSQRYDRYDDRDRYRPDDRYRNDDRDRYDRRDDRGYDRPRYETRERYASPPRRHERERSPPRGRSPPRMQYRERERSPVRTRSPLRTRSPIRERIYSPPRSVPVRDRYEESRRY
jgi:hypothetical protein